MFVWLVLERAPARGIRAVAGSEFAVTAATASTRLRIGYVVAGSESLLYRKRLTMDAFPIPMSLRRRLIRSFPFAHPSDFPSMSPAPANSIVEDLPPSPGTFAQGYGVTSQAAIAQFVAVTRVKELPGFPIANDLKK